MPRPLCIRCQGILALRESKQKIVSHSVSRSSQTGALHLIHTCLSLDGGEHMLVCLAATAQPLQHPVWVAITRVVIATLLGPTCLLHQLASTRLLHDLLYSLLLMTCFGCVATVLPELSSKRLQCKKWGPKGREASGSHNFPPSSSLACMQAYSGCPACLRSTAMKEVFPGRWP